MQINRLSLRHNPAAARDFGLRQLLASQDKGALENALLSIAYKLFGMRTPRPADEIVPMPLPASGSIQVRCPRIQQLSIRNVRASYDSNNGISTFAVDVKAFRPIGAAEIESVLEELSQAVAITILGQPVFGGMSATISSAPGQERMGVEEPQFPVEYMHVVVSVEKMS